MPAPRTPGNHARIEAVVRRIPRGRVATYGQVAVLAGLPGHARQVGYALHALARGSPVPLQRVVNARREVSLPRTAGWESVQRALFVREGIDFDARGRIDLERRLWRPCAGPRRKIRAKTRKTGRGRR